MRSNLEAVQEIERTATTVVVQEAARRALVEGSDGALLYALVEARTKGVTRHVVEVANEQLGRV
jgi:hypothetical protein